MFSMDRETLDDLIYSWVIFRQREFDEVSWQGISISGKMMEFGKLGIISPGTKNESNEIYIPEHIEVIQNAILQLPLYQQQVLKEEYENRGTQYKKARRLKIRLKDYRARLCRARKKLMEML